MPDKQHKSETDDKEEISISLEAFKNRWQWILLILIVLFGAYFRYYHIDYPVIGYHNWKESRYLEEARNFADDGFFKYGFLVASFDYPGIHGDPSGAHSGEFPALSILIAILFSIFGMSLYIARFFTLLLSLCSIIIMYLLMKELFDREDIALSSAFAMALMPMLVFFTHNVDVINVGLPLMLLGAYFYVLWVKHDKGRDMILATVFIMISAISKYEFLVIGIPMLFIFPWRRLNELRKFGPKYHPYIISVMIFALLPLQYIYSLYISKVTGSAAVTSSLIDVSVIFTSTWWQTLKAYTADNYTILGFYVALFGIAFMILMFKRKNLGYRFGMGYFIGTIFYFIIMSKKLGGHSYHQYPVAPFFALMIAYCLVFVATNASKIIKMKIMKPLFIIVLFIILYFPSAAAWNRQFDTQFYGLDIAGDYIKGHSQPDERIIHSDFQDYGVLWHADRKGIVGIIPNSCEIRLAEENLN
ncbi:MAG: glycosyltransferase family 39 protein, partial [Candidatus Woesearchaeota archaeon]|nr:glycosyltransferase family 39 protein [Candidatus Woesearchaeota archaeon]